MISSSSGFFTQKPPPICSRRKGYSLEYILLKSLVHYRRGWACNDIAPFQQISYSDLVIKLMNSEDIYLNLRLTNYISLLNNLRDSILLSKNDVT